MRFSHFEVCAEFQLQLSIGAFECKIIMIKDLKVSFGKCCSAFFTPYYLTNLTLYNQLKFSFLPASINCFALTNLLTRTWNQRKRQSKQVDLFNFITYEMQLLLKLYCSFKPCINLNLSWKARHEALDKYVLQLHLNYRLNVFDKASL